MRDEDDLFTDDGEQKELLASIHAAEKEHGAEFKTNSRMNEEDFKNLISEKTSMKFEGDEFVKNDAANYMKASNTFVQMSEDFDRREPIGNIMVGIDVNEVTDKVLQGAQLNDEDDQAETLESLKSAERVSGAKLNTPEFTEKNFAKQGNLAKDFMEDDTRVYTKYLSDAFTDQETEDKLAKQRQDAEKARIASTKKVQKKQVEESENFLNIHFREDDDI